MEDLETACAMSQHWTKSSVIFNKEGTAETTRHMLGPRTEQKLMFSSAAMPWVSPAAAHTI